MDRQPEEKQVFREGEIRLRTGCIAEGLLSAFPPCNVDADGGGGCGSPGDTRLVGEMGDSRLC